jgi:hypothetical protein
LVSIDDARQLFWALCQDERAAALVALPDISPPRRDWNAPSEFDQDRKFGHAQECPSAQRPLSAVPPAELFSEGVFVNHPVLHDDLHVLFWFTKNLDVLQRVSFYNENVGISALLNDPKWSVLVREARVCQSEYLRVFRGRLAQDLKGFSPPEPRFKFRALHRVVSENSNRRVHREILRTPHVDFPPEIGSSYFLQQTEHQHSP